MKKFFTRARFALIAGLCLTALTALLSAPVQAQDQSPAKETVDILMVGDSITTLK